MLANMDPNCPSFYYNTFMDVFCGLILWLYLWFTGLMMFGDGRAEEGDLLVTMLAPLLVDSGDPLPW